MPHISDQDMALLKSISQVLFDKKGYNILTLDVRGISSMTDFFIIAEGSVEKHVQALSRQLAEQIGELGHKPDHIEGQAEGAWIVLDYGHFIVHLFIPEMREKYRLEQVWREGAIVDVPICFKK
jgi:ribosome-associated protein